MSGIELTQVSKQYDDGSKAVNDLDLRIDDGEFMILVGPSGCGKSTTLRMIAGLEEISGGELRIGGEIVNELAPKERDIAMVFQNYALYPHMTVAENMGFSLRLAKVSKAEIERRVRDAAQILDLTEHLGRKPSQLSGGQRQRVAMGRATVREPQAFLMDEPLSNLDAKLRVQMRASVARLQERLGTTTVYVTHDQTEAMTLGHRVAVMKDGVLQQVAPPKELYERPANAFVAGFIGSPAMNFLRAERAGDVLRTALGDLPLPERLRAVSGGVAELVVGLRPESFDDAELAGAAPGHVFEADVELVEEMGAESFAHLPVAADALRVPGGLEGQDEGDGAVVARFGHGSRIAGRGRARLWLDTERMHLFDGATGAALR